MDLSISPGLIIGAVVIFLVVINAGILVSFIRNKNNRSTNVYGKLIKGSKNTFHKDKDNIAELSKLLSELDTPDEK